MFDPNKTYKFRHLQNAGLVRDRDDLKTKQQFGFPLGRLLTPRDRQWTGKELNTYLNSRPVTQAEFNALLLIGPRRRSRTFRNRNCQRVRAKLSTPAARIIPSSPETKTPPAWGGVCTLTGQVTVAAQAF